MIISQQVYSIYAVMFCHVTFFHIKYTWQAMLIYLLVFNNVSNFVDNALYTTVRTYYTVQNANPLVINFVKITRFGIWFGQLRLVSFSNYSYPKNMVTRETSNRVFSCLPTATTVHVYILGGSFCRDYLMQYLTYSTAPCSTVFIAYHTVHRTRTS